MLVPAQVEVLERQPWTLVPSWDVHTKAGSATIWRPELLELLTCNDDGSKEEGDGGALK